MQIVKIILFIILCMGYYIYIKRKNIVKEEFIPIILISSISLVIYCAGILNFLNIATWGIGIIGVVVFIREIYIIIKNKQKISINRNIVFLLFMLFGAALILKGTVLTHYDNFSHWGMIIREMLITDKFPNFESSVIMFSSYPPGTACTVYFICKYLGTSEAIMLFAQAILILTSLYTLFAFCNKENKSNYVISGIAIIYLLIGNIFIDELLVDTVLSVMGIAAMAIIFYYKEDNKKGLIFSTPLLTLLMIVKNSGMFFIIINIILWMIFLHKNSSLKNILKTKYFYLIFLPIIAMLIWNAHTDLVFESAATSKHSMSIENYIDNFTNKDTEIFKNITNKMLKKMTDITNIDNQILLLLLVVYFIIIISEYKNKELRNTTLKMLIIYIITYVLYQFGLLGMYLFSMPKNEAINLAAYSRYFKTMVMFNFGTVVISILNFLKNCKLEKTRLQFLKIFLIISCIIPVIFFDKQHYQKMNFSSEVRQKILTYKSTYNIEEEKTYLVYLSDNFLHSPDYYYYICKYDFRSTDVKVIKTFSQLQNMDRVFDYDYFIILNKDESVLEFLNKIGGNVDTDVIKFR